MLYPDFDIDLLVSEANHLLVPAKQSPPTGPLHFAYPQRCPPHLRIYLLRSSLPVLHTLDQGHTFSADLCSQSLTSACIPQDLELGLPTAGWGMTLYTCPMAVRAALAVSMSLKTGTRSRLSRHHSCLLPSQHQKCTNIGCHMTSRELALP